VTQDAPARLHLVTDNSLATAPAISPEPGPADTGARSIGPASAPVAEPGGPAAVPVRLPTLALAGVALTLGLALLGRQPWQLPERTGGALSEVPQSLVTFLLVCAAACVWTAGRLVRPAQLLRSPAAVRMWWALLAGATVVSLAAGLSLASLAGTGQQSGDLLVRWALPVVPAVLAGALAADAGRAARIRVALGTGLVTVPLAGLGWALLSSPAGSPAGLGDVLAMTGLSAFAPLALAVAFVAADRRSRTAP
jgi:hypothetical protein